jgi:hypothetical protein
MKCRRTHLLGIIAIALVGASPAFAQLPPDDQAKLCEKEYVNSKSWGNLHQWPYPIVAKLKDGSVSAACKSEIERGAQRCLSESFWQKEFARQSAGSPGMTINDFCNYQSFTIYWSALENIEREAAEAKKNAEKEAAADKARQEKIEKTEVPTGVKKDPALEKAVAAAYHKAYPSNRVIKVILFQDDYLEKDLLGRIIGKNLGATVVNKHPDGKCELHYQLWLQYGNGAKFSGPFSSRVAASEDQEILCSKAEASVSGSTTKKHK